MLPRSTTMRRFLTVTAQSVLIGLLLGLAARIVMRVIAIIQGDEPEFTVAATAGIMSFFAIAAVGGGWGGGLARHPRIGLGLAVLATAPIAALGVAIGGGDLSQSVDDQPLGVFIVIVLCAIVIAGCVVASPVLAWRLSRRRSSVRRSTAP